MILSHISSFWDFGSPDAFSSFGRFKATSMTPDGKKSGSLPAWRQFILITIEVPTLTLWWELAYPWVFKPENFDFSVCLKKKVQISCAISATVWSLWWCNLLLIVSGGSIGPKATMATCTCCNIPLNIQGFKSPDVRHGRCDKSWEGNL